MTSKGRFDNSLYIATGPGLYIVKAYVSKNKDATDRTYEFTKEFRIRNKDTRDGNFILPTNMVQSDNSEIVTLVNSLTRGATSDKEKIAKIFDYIIKNIKYDYPGYQDNSYKTKPYDAVTILHLKVTVCAGYSNLLAAMARAAGIKAKVINGQIISEGQLIEHAWNKVYIDGKWEIIDSTWSVGRTTDKNRYFFAIPSVFKEDHVTERDLDY